MQQIISQFSEFDTVQFAFTREVVIVEDGEGNLTKTYTGNKQLVIRGNANSPVEGIKYPAERITGITQE